jgi:hypothetical protein
VNPQVPGLILLAGEVPAPVCVDGVCAPVPGSTEPADQAEQATPAP